MKSYYCSGCNKLFGKLFNCKYESYNSWFLFCYNCVLDRKKIYKNSFKFKLKNFDLDRFVLARKKRNKINGK